MRTLPVALLLVALATPLRGAAAQVFASERGTVTFTSRVPLHTFEGTSGHLNGEVDLASASVDFYVDLETLETGIGRRDRDMRETLETDRYPFAEFTGRLVTPVDLSQRRPQPARVRGTFSLHGVARPVEIDGTIEPTSRGLRVRAAWEVRLDDYAIEPPRLLIVKVDEVQAVAIDITLARR